MAPENSDQGSENLYSIGEVAEATGLSVDTIRVWERRYGRPRPQRLDSGHRRYLESQIRWLRRVAEALSKGHRPSAVVPLSEGELDDRLEPEEHRRRDPELERLLGLVREYRGPELYEALNRHATENGARAFVLERAAPLCTMVGRAWADADLEIRHEHFLSGILSDLLRVVRDGIRKPPDDGPIVLLATLAGEYHGLGIQMAAIFAKLSGARVRILGTDLPRDEIVRAAGELGALVVGIGISLFTGGPSTDRELAALRTALSEGTHLVAGGRGARGVRRGPRGIEYMIELPDFGRWLETIVR